MTAEENDMNAQGAVEKLDRAVEVEHYTIKNRARVGICKMTVTSQGKTVSCEGETISKDVREAKLLRNRAEAVAYARCLALLTDNDANVDAADVQ